MEPSLAAKDGRASVHALVAACATMAIGAVAAADPPLPRCASRVVSYVAGSGAGGAYQNPLRALGAPSRYTGTGIEPGAVTPFRPAFLSSELVSIGRGGQLVLAFDQPIVDDPRNPWGVDLIVYGNAMFGDLAYPGGVPGYLFDEGGAIELSPDGITWHAVPGARADGGLPTMGYADVGPYSTVAGLVPTDPARPVDPAVTADSLLGAGYEDVVAAYGGAAGGTGIDLADAGLATASFIRIRVAADAATVPEVDAVVAVRPRRMGDIDDDGDVDGADLGLMLGAWGSAAAGTAADLDADGDVDGADLGLMLGGWGP
jgi:hypothetical protein